MPIRVGRPWQVSVHRRRLQGPSLYGRQMRLWTIHPRYLDRQGLLALWREGLLAQAVLLGRTKGYTRHPQLTRFRRCPSPIESISAYLDAVHAEALRRGYRFDRTKIERCGIPASIPETKGQLLYEWRHLRSKLRARSPEHYLSIRRIKEPEPHPLFTIITGNVRDWEKIKSETEAS
jgi:hypothetical protein